MTEGMKDFGQSLNFYRRFATAFILAAAQLWPASALAGSPSANPGGSSLKDLSLEQLGDVEVSTASKTPEQVWKTAAAIFVITQDDIRRSGARSIPEALRLAPGVEVARLNSDEWSIGIRGFGSRNSRSVLVLIDGRTVYTSLFAGTYWEVQDTLLQDVERIEVIRGPGATIWGPNAVNGVINIITKSSQDTHGELVSVGGGSIEQGFFDTRYGGGNGHNFDYRGYVKGFNRGPQFHPDRGNYDRWRGIQAGFRSDWEMDPKNTFTFQGDLYRVGFGERVTATSYTAPYKQTLDGTAPLSGGNVLAKWKQTGAKEDLQLQAYYDRAARHEVNFGDVRDTFDIDFLQRLRLLKRQEISWGLGARAIKIHDIEVFSGLTFQPSRRTDYLFSAFLQDDIDLVRDRLVLSLGSKFFRTNFTGLELEPSARLRWNVTPTQTLWTAFTHALRTPSDAEHDFFLSGFITVDPSSGLPFFARFNPNRNFKPEQLNGYEIGYRRLLGPKFYFDLSAFYNHYSDLFSLDITGSPFIENSPAPTHILLPAEFGNGLVGTTKGIEFAPEVKPIDFWRLRLAYSFLQMRIKEAPNSQDIGTAASVEGTSPRHQVSLTSSFEILKSFDLDLSYRYVSSLTAQQIPSYSTGDARFAWQVGQQFELAVVGRNLMQPHHPEFARDPGPNSEIKRSVYGQITWMK